jgi:hypothetical protein
MLSTKGDDFTLWVWDKTRENLQQLTHREVDFENVRDRKTTIAILNHL